MGDAGGHGPPLQAVALEVANADMAGVLVALYYGDFEDVPLRVDVVGVALVGGDDLAGHHADDAPGTPLGEVLRREMGEMEGVVGPADQVGVDHRGGEVPDGGPVVHLHALFEDLLDVEVLEVVDDHEVRQVPRRDGPPVVEEVVPRRVVAGHPDGQNGVRPQADSLPDVVVDVALLQQVIGVLVVAAEHAPLRVLGRHEGHEGG